MKSIAFVSAAVLFLGTSPAYAEEDRSSEADENFAFTAPTDALELTLGNGFSQGFGTPDGRVGALSDLTRGGFSTQLGIGYRLDPRWTFGAYGEGARYFAASGTPDGTVGYGAALGVQAQWHLSPFTRIDPWIGVGAGLRGYWVDSPDGDESLYGFDLVRLRVGADYKLGPSTSVGPMIGATLTTFSTRFDVDSDELDSTADPELTTFVFAGIQGRFSIGGERVRASGRSVASR